jgi:molybdopterin-guanine dinucleotide biosynthesis protein A
VEGFDAIVLAGGGGRRLGGIDKATVTIGAQTLLERALASLAAADRIVVVGPDRPHLARQGGPIVSTQEQPPGGGPVAAIAAGLAHVAADVVIALACDMPFFDAAAAERLAAEIGRADAAMFVDGTGRRQYLAAAYRRRSLEGAIGALPAVDGASMRELAERLTITELLTDPEVTLDCDTWDDINRSRQLLEER